MVELRRVNESLIVIFSTGQKNFLSVALGYGLALMIGILVSGGVSGGHLNPAVTLSMACLNKLRWLYVPVYMIAQYLGAFVGAAIVYGLYIDGGIDGSGNINMLS